MKRFISYHWKLLLAIGAGCIAFGVLAAFVQDVNQRIALAWDTGILFYVGNTFRSMRCASTKELNKNAYRADVSGLIMFVVMIFAAFLSLYLALALMHDVKEAKSIAHEAGIALAVVTVISSWAMVQVMFAVHYTHHYYSHNEDGDSKGNKKAKSSHGGLRFPSSDDGEEPDFWDFLYFSLVLGMTFQVSDVQVTQRHMRHIALWHSVIAFFFNTFILASMVNMAASLFT